MENVFLIVHSRRTSMNYSLTMQAIAKLGEFLQLDESVWVVRTDRDLTYVEDYMSFQAGNVDLLFITQLVPGGWRMNVFAKDKAASTVLGQWLPPQHA